MGPDSGRHVGLLRFLVQGLRCSTTADAVRSPPSVPHQPAGPPPVFVSGASFPEAARCEACRGRRAMARAPAAYLKGAPTTCHGFPDAQGCASYWSSPMKPPPRSTGSPVRRLCLPDGSVRTTPWPATLAVQPSGHTSDHVRSPSCSRTQPVSSRTSVPGMDPAIALCPGCQVDRARGSLAVASGLPENRPAGDSGVESEVHAPRRTTTPNATALAAIATLLPGGAPITMQRESHATFRAVSWAWKPALPRGGPCLRSSASCEVRDPGYPINASR